MLITGCVLYSYIVQNHDFSVPYATRYKGKANEDVNGECENRDIVELTVSMLSDRY